MSLKKKELALKSHKALWQMYKEYKKGQQITLGESTFQQKNFTMGNFLIPFF